MQPFDLSRMSAEDIYRESEKYNAKIDLQMVRQLITAYTLSSAQLKPKYLNMLKMMFDRITHIALKTDKPFLKIPEKSVGSLQIGKFMQGGETFTECLLEPDQLIQTVIVGSPNRGKTKLMFGICKQIDLLNQRRSPEKRIGILCFDNKRQDFRNLDIPMVALRIPHDISINILEPPPECDTRRWFSEISQLLMSIWGIYFASRNFLLSVINDLYESKSKIPTLLEVYEAIKDKQETQKRFSPRRLDIQDVNLDRLQNALMEFGASFATKRKSFPFWEFIKNRIHLVIESDLSNDSYALLVGWALLYAYRYNKSNNIRGNISNGGILFVIDEAYTLWEASRDFSESRRELGANFVSQSPLYVRDFSIAICAASQRPLSPDYMGASNLKIVSYLGDYNDARYIASSLGDPELVEVIARLGIGEWIVKIGDQQPALLKTEDYPTGRISDEELEQRMQPFLEYVKNYCSEPEETEEVKEQKQHEKLSPEAKAMIMHVYDHPLTKLTNRYEDLKLTGAKAQQIITELKEKGYAETIQEAIDNPHKSTYLILKEPALTWLKSQGKDVSYLLRIGRVSFTHAFYAMVLSRTLRNLGWKVTNEQSVGNKFVDVYAENKDKKIAYEIAISPSVDAARVKSALDMVDEYIFLCKDMLIINSIENQLKELVSDKIKYYIASNYILDLKKAVLDHYTQNNQNNENKPENGDSSSNEERTRSDS